MRDNDFTWWQHAVGGVVAPIDANDPQTGYFKVREKRGGELVPVAFWWKDGECRCRINGNDVSAERAVELWPWASRHPVTYEDYTARIKTGKWPGEHEAVIGHNKAPMADDAEGIKERIEDLAREAEKMIAAGAATSEAISDQASDLANTFGEIESKIRELHKTEKEPHLEAGRVVDKKWFGLRDLAADLKRRLKLVVVTPFLNKKADEAAKAAQAAVQAGANPETLPQTRITSGSSKRSTALRTQISAEVTDWDAIITALKAHPDVREAIQKIANASAKAGVELPGMKIIKTKVAA